MSQYCFTFSKLPTRGLKYFYSQKIHTTDNNNSNNNNTNGSYLLDGNQKQQGQEGPRRGPESPLPRGGGRPGPPGGRDARGHCVGSGQGSHSPTPGPCPPRFRPHLPRRAVTSAGTLLERSKMYHRRPPLAFLFLRRENVCTNPLDAAPRASAPV